MNTQQTTTYLSAPTPRHCHIDPEPSGPNASQLMAALQTELDQILDRTPLSLLPPTSGILRSPPRGGSTPQARLMKRFRTVFKIDASITRLPQPVIAKVHATATAAGCQLVATCDLAIAAETAKFATPGVNIAFSAPLHVGLPQRRAQTDDGDAADRQMMDAENAVAAGLINSTCPPDLLNDAVAALRHHLVETALT